MRPPCEQTAALLAAADAGGIHAQKAGVAVRLRRELLSQTRGTRQAHRCIETGAGGPRRAEQRLSDGRRRVGRARRDDRIGETPAVLRQRAGPRVHTDGAHGAIVVGGARNEPPTAGPNDTVAKPIDRTVRILDFGSGKSYLTFALYHFLHEMKGYDVHITGLDLKKEVIEECAKIARDLEYERLEFLVGDINEYEGETAVDMVVTLHACDVATDMALARAVRWGAKVILSVPCCQKELNRQLNAPNLELMLQHGLIKERFASLATDSIRAELLGLVGYDAQLLEFIDLEHTPKNIMIRAYLTNRKATEKEKQRYLAFKQMLQAEPFLERELSDRLVLETQQDVK